MADERKSSEDLVREANRKFRSSPDLPDAVSRPADPHRPVGTGDPRDPVDSKQSMPVFEEPQSREYVAHPSPDHGLIAGDPVDSVRTQPARTSRLVGLVVRFGLGLAVFAGFGLFSSFNDASRDDSGEIVAAGELDVLTLQVGDCFDDPADLDDVVFEVAALPCSEPHDNEVYSVLSVVGTFGDAFPGDVALEEHSYEVCQGEPFGSYVGTDYLDSSLEVFTFTPSEESWDMGDRDVVCALFRLDFSKLTGTARDSGL
jgi:hypothetical protein